MKPEKKTETFEKSLTDLEKIVRQLESGDLPLEESLRLFEEGVRLSRECQERLTQAERRIEVLMRDKNGNPVLETLNEDNFANKTEPIIKRRIVFADDEDDDESPF
jgi:exodeoxyribonuclease VII small subunit